MAYQCSVMTSLTSAAYPLSIPKFVVFAFQLMEKELSQVQS